MKLTDYLSLDSVFINISAASKKKALEIASEQAAKKLNVDTSVIFEALIAREKLGSTAIGRGIALPHCRLNDINQPLIIFMKLKEGVDFAALDNMMVNIIIAIFIPQDANNAYLQLLANLATFLSDTTNLNQLQVLNETASLYHVMVDMNV